MSADTLSFQTRGLSEDCGHVDSGAQTGSAPIEVSELLAKLQAFAAIPGVDLIDAKPTITVNVSGGGEFTISNESGTLFMIESPASENSPMQKTPEEIVRFLDETFQPAEVEEAEEVVVRTSKTRSILNSPWLLAALLAGWAGIAYVTLREPGPEGVTMISDADRSARFAEQMQGRYGADAEDGDTLYVIAGDRFKVFDVTDAGVDPAAIFDVSFELGQRGGDVVLVLETGAVISRTDAGDLVFGDETYPRL